MSGVNFQFAKDLLNMKLSIIPVRFKEKIPKSKWQEYQNRVASLEEVESWFNAPTNIGIVTGKISGKIVVDSDSPEAEKWISDNLPSTPMKTKTAKGFHRYYLYPLETKIPIKNKVKFFANGKNLEIDIRGDGGQVLAPFSIHPSGAMYEMETDWKSIKTEDIPIFSPDWFQQTETPELKKSESQILLNPSILQELFIKGPANEGQGGDSHTFQVACYLTRDRGLSLEDAFLHFREWNKTNIPPWNEKDLREKLVSSLKYGSGSISKGNQLRLTPIKDLLAEPNEEIEWLLKDRLPAVGTSLLASKPKIGKTTLSRGLAIAVASGKDFLGWPTKKTPVIYIAAEENRAQFKKALASSKIGDIENLYIHTGPVPTDLVSQLSSYINELKAGLIILDTLIRVVNVKDTNDYASMSKAMEPFQELAVKYQCQILLLHHAGKVERDHGDGVLGSTAIFGSIDSLLFLDRKKDKNYLRTIQRYGESLDPHLILYDKETKEVSLGGNAGEIHKMAVEDKILNFISNNPNSFESDIHETVEGHRKSILFGVRSLLSEGKISRSGSGKKGDPYRYSIPNF